jgi:predicted RND superfamily exporter protein
VRASKDHSAADTERTHADQTERRLPGEQPGSSPGQPGAPSGSSWDSVRARIEVGFERWGHLVHRRPWPTLLVSLLAVAAFASAIPRLEIDTSSEGFLEPGDPVRVQYDSFREQFGNEEVAVVAIRTDEVFDLAFLERLRSLHDALEEEVPHLEDVTSLVNVRNTYGVGDELRVDDFLEDWPETTAELADLRARALANPLYRGVLLSDDAGLTAIMVEAQAFSSASEIDDALLGFDDAESTPGSDVGDEPDQAFLSGAENTAFVEAIQSVVARFDEPGFDIHVAGRPVLVDRIMSQMLADMGLFTALSLGVIGAFLAFLFRSGLVVLLVLGTSALSVLSGFGFMAAVGIPLTSATQIMPSFLLAISVGNSVHLVVIFLQQRARGRDCEAALAYALGHSGLAIVMTALTTAGSLVSFLNAEVAIVADFGVVGPGGVLIALMLSLVTLPALIALTPIRARAPTVSALRRLPEACGSLGARFPGAVLTLWLLLFAVSVGGAMQLRFSNYAIGWFQPESPLRIAMELIDETLGGAESFQLVVDAGRENGLYEPDLLGRIEAAQDFAEGQVIGDGRGVVGRTTISIVQVVKEIHQALNANDPDSYRIPDDRDLIAQELLLFENSGTDDLEDVVDSQFQLARVAIKLPVVDSVYAVDLLERLQDGFAEILGSATHFVITGQTSISATTVTAMIRSVSRTYLLAFAIITPFMVLLLGSLRTGLLSMIPAMGAILVTLGVMGWLSLPIEAFTILTACIALGLAVDDTIHFMHNYARARQRGASAPDAIRTTLESTGQALFFTSLVLTAGFLIYTQASLNMLFNFGLTTALAVSMAFVANVTLAPALVTLVARWSRNPEVERLPEPSLR